MSKRVIINQAMLAVAEELADELRYIEVAKWNINGLTDSFWGNRVLALKQYPQKLIIKASKYISPIWEDDKNKDIAQPKIEIDMHWGNPRLSIRKVDGTFCCLSYNESGFREAQAFGEDGLPLAAKIKERIDKLINELL